MICALRPLPFRRRWRVCGHGLCVRFGANALFAQPGQDLEAHPVDAASPRRCNNGRPMIGRNGIAPLHLLRRDVNDADFPRKRAKASKFGDQIISASKFHVTINTLCIFNRQYQMYSSGNYNSYP